MLLWLGISLVGILLFTCAPKVEQPVTPVLPREAPVIEKIEKKEWEVKWEKILQEARKEGVVYVYGPPLPEVRKALTDEFPKAYPGLKLDYTGLTGGELMPKIKAEYGAGIRQVDIVISGTTTIFGIRAHLQPMKPFLILPEVTNPKLWRGGKLDFADKAGEINLVFSYNTKSDVFYNTELVDPREITSFWDLVKPKWKGKISIGDPRTPGPTNGLVSIWYIVPELGPDYFKAFIANEPVVIRDARLQAESVSRGKHSIGIGSLQTIISDLEKAGAPIKYTKAMKEGAQASASFGTVAVTEKPPNPNAATIFLNWLLGKEGQTVFATKADYYSCRVDVSSSHLSEAFIPEPGANYVDTYKEEFNEKRPAIDDYLRKTFAGF